MITIFNRKEVYIGFSMGKFAEVRDILAANQIKYDISVVNTNDRGSFGGRDSSWTTGLNMEYMYEYHVYVHKKDFDQAQYLINCARR